MSTFFVRFIALCVRFSTFLKKVSNFFDYFLHLLLLWMNSVEFFGSLVCLFVLFCFVYFSFGVETDKEQVRKIRHFSWAWHFCKLTCYFQDLVGIWRLHFCEYFSKFTRSHHWKISTAFCIIYLPIVSYLLCTPLNMANTPPASKRWDLIICWGCSTG